MRLRRSVPYLEPMRWARLVAVAAVALAALLLPAAAGAEVRTFTLRSGPYQLGGYSTKTLRTSVPRPSLSGYVTKMHARLVDGRGRPVTVAKAMLHHVFFKNLDVERVKDACPKIPGETFYGTGEEDQALDLPDGYGYRLRKGDRWEMGAMLMGHRYRGHEVYVQYRVTVDTAERVAVRPLWVRATGCDFGSMYNVPGDGSPGSIHDRVYRWKVPITGRIVAAGGHLHAGSVNLQLRDPACGDRVLFDNRPSYAPASDLLYHVSPRLHEAGPIQTSWFSSPTGIPILKGQVLDLHGLYENDHARQSVMSITHLYVAPAARGPAGCPPLPADARQAAPGPGQRPSVPYQSIPLYRLDRRHRTVELAEPEGPSTPLADGATIALRAFQFRPEKVTIRAGSTINWRFDDVAKHNLTLASGPVAVAGQQNFERGERTSTRFEVPGRYQFFCYLHPMTMHEQVDVVP